MKKQKEDREKKPAEPEQPPVQEVPSKEEVPDKTNPGKNPGGNRENEPEEQISG